MRLLFALVMMTGTIISAASGRNLSFTPMETMATDSVNETVYTFSVATYLVQHGRDYANPTVTIDPGAFHFESRYNYEALKTGSAWIGYNFSVGKKLVLEATPMVGGVFGDITGIAPGYTITISYDPIQLFTQGEYFFDAEKQSGNFFYNWSEFSCSPSRWFKFGLVLDRTKAFGSSTDIRRGPFIGFKYKKIDFNVYWLGPGSSEGTFVFGTTINF